MLPPSDCSFLDVEINVGIAKAVANNTKPKKDKSGQASLMMCVKPWCTHSSLRASTTRTIPPSADNAAAFATCAKLRSPARQPYEKIRPHHASAAASALATDLCATDVSNSCVCLVGDA